MNHDKIIDDLVNRLYYNHPDAEIWHNQEYQNKGIWGECDVGMADNDLLYLIEVKSTDTPRGRYKAKRQLKKDIEYYTSLYEISQIWAFYAYSDRHQGRGYNVKEIYHISQIDTPKRNKNKNKV